MIYSLHHTSVLSFINAPDFRIPLDANVNNVYEVEAEVSDGVDGNSSTQIIQVTVIPNGDYLGNSGTACRAGTQNEGHPEDPNNSNYFTITNGVNSLEDCQALCDAYPLIDTPSINCTGVEYRTEGADYADTASRCELWKVPIVATTPQKEYACYLRGLVRDEYGPDIAAYAGDYKATDTDESGSSVTTTMVLSQLSPSELLWTAEDGNSWTVVRIADRNKLQVGGDYPYIGDGHEEPRVFWNADEVAGITGPSGRIYRTDWAHAKLSQLQAVYRAYINNHPGEPIRVEEAERLIRELKWAIAERINTAAAYRAYMIDIGEYYGRTQEAEIRIAGFKAFVTAEVLQIEVDTEVPAYGEDNDLELFYNLEFTKNWRYRADNENWSVNDLILTSVPQIDGSKITNINDGADRAFIPAGNALKTIEATENETLRYGGLMFEMDSTPEGFLGEDAIQNAIDDCNWYGPGDFEPDFTTCEALYADTPRLRELFSNTPVETPNGTVNGIFSGHWNGHRTWAGNASNAGDSLDSSYFTIAMAGLEYGVPKVETKSITFASDEEIRLKYEITKRTEEKHNEYLADNFSLSCDDPALKREKLTPRNAVTIDPPGFLIRNETDQTYSVSLNQVGPLYYGEVRPGQIFKRDTAWGHFTIDALLNMTGEERYDNWDVAIPIVVFTADVLQSVVTAGVPIKSIQSAIKAGVGSVIRSTGTKLAATTAARASASALARTAFGRATMRVGAQALEFAAENGHKVVITMVKKGAVTATYGIGEALDEAFSQDMADNIYTEENTGEYRTWRFSGGPLTSVGMYHLVGGPRLPCLNKDGDVEIRATELQILNDEECAASPICTLH